MFNPSCRGSQEARVPSKRHTHDRVPHPPCFAQSTGEDQLLTEKTQAMLKAGGGAGMSHLATVMLT